MITLDMLWEKKACIEQREVFAKLFPEGVEPTPEICLSVADKFEWHWASKELLSAPARRLFNKTVAPARNLYYETVVPARKHFNETMEAARKHYNETTAPAWKLFDETVDPARKHYNETTAVAFAEAYQSMKGN